MQSTLVSNQITLIEKDIEGLEKLVSFKNKVNKYNNISNKIQECRKYISEINLDYKSETPGPIDEKEYVILLDEISKIEKNVTGKDLEDLVLYYKKISANIEKCEHYLFEQKMELIYEKN